MVTGDDLWVSTQVNGIGGGQYGVVSTALRVLQF